MGLSHEQLNRKGKGNDSFHQVTTCTSFVTVGVGPLPGRRAPENESVIQPDPGPEGEIHLMFRIHADARSMLPWTQLNQMTPALPAAFCLGLCLGFCLGLCSPPFPSPHQAGVPGHEGPGAVVATNLAQAPAGCFVQSRFQAPHPQQL